MLPTMVNSPNRTTLTASSSQHFSQTIVQNLYEGIVVMDVDHSVIFANGTAEVLLGYAPGELVSRPCREFLDEEACELMALSAGQAHRYSTKLRHPDGRTIPAVITMSGARINGQEVRLISIAALPDLGPLQEALMMEQRLAGIGMLTASIAHELTNPLSIITTTCENLKHAISEDAPHSLQLAKYAGMVQKNAWRCAELVDTLRTYTHSKQTPQESNLNDIVRQALFLLSDQFRQKWGIHVGTALDPNLKPITGDKNQLLQVLMNLLLNARDAMQPDGGEVQIKTWTVHELDAVALSVTDTGHGVEESDMEAIFDPFFTTKPLGEGTGLGLFISAEIIREHKGWIRAQNNTTAGATFTVMLPGR